MPINLLRQLPRVMKQPNQLKRSCYYYIYNLVLTAGILFSPQGVTTTLFMALNIIYYRLFIIFFQHTLTTNIHFLSVSFLSSQFSALFYRNRLLVSYEKKKQNHAVNNNEQSLFWMTRGRQRNVSRKFQSQTTICQ